MPIVSESVSAIDTASAPYGRKSSLGARRVLMLGTALGCSIAILTGAGSAQAACVVGPTTVTCSDPVYNTDITETSIGDLTLVIANGVRVNGGVSASAANLVIDATGAVIDSPGAGVVGYGQGSVTITTTDVTAAYGIGILASADGEIQITSGAIATDSNGADGVRIYGFQDVVIDSGTISTTGYSAYGMRIEAEGDVTITSEQISTTGFNADGIDVQNYAGLSDVFIRSGNISTEGYGSLGIDVDVYGDVVIHSGTLSTAGYGADGIDVHTDGDVTITSTSLSTAGYSSIGIDVSTDGDVSITSGTLSTAGEGSEGIDVSTNGSVRIISQSLTTAGVNAEAMDIGADGDVTITSGSLATLGDGSEAIDVSADGAVAITSQSITTAGTFAQAMDIYASGDVTINSGSIATSGYAAEGILVSTYSAAAIVSQSITTEGEFAKAIYVGADGDVTITSGSIATGGYGAEGIDVSAYGAVAIVSQSIATAGEFAQAMDINADGDVSITSGSIETQGNHAHGMDIDTLGAATVVSDQISTAGNYSSGVWVYQADGLAVESGSITTSGFVSRGIAAYVGGDITIDSDTITTSGDLSSGIMAVAFGGDISIAAASITTTGQESHGVSATSDVGDVAVAAGSITTSGPDAHGVWVSSVDGDVSVQITGDVASAGGLGVRAEGGSVTVTVAEGATVTGVVGGVRAFSTTSTTINLAGSVSSSDGFAIITRGGASTINNTGNTIIGAISLSGSDDVVNNSGSFIAAGDSEFGAGADVFNNSGLLRFVDHAVAASVSFNELEVFNNSGRIDLANGIAGDVLDMSGSVFNGLAGSRLMVDANGETSDVLLVADATGVTTVTVSDTSDVGIGELATFVRSSSVETGTEFVIDGAQRGLIGYDIVFDAGDNSFAVTGRAGLHALDPLRFVDGAQNLWHKGGDGWSTRMNEVRDTASARPDGLEAWAQALFGSDQFNSGPRSYAAFGSDVVADLSYDQDYIGFTAGFDVRRSSERGSTLWGVTTGLMRSKMDLESATSAKYSGYNLGAYAGLTRDAFFVNALVRMDGYTLDAMIPAAPAYESVDGVNLGAKVEAGARFEGGRWFAEPLARLAWVETDLDGFSVDGGDFDYDKGSSLKAELGLRVGAKYRAGPGVSLAPHIALFAVEELEGDNEMRLTLGSAVDTLVDTPAERHGRVEVGVTVWAPKGLEAFAQGEALFGGDAEGFTARAGVRWRF